MNKLKFKPMRDELVVDLLEDDKLSDRLVVIDKSNTEHPKKGIVLAVGPGKVLDDGQVIQSGIKEGDVIYFMRNGGHKISLDSQNEVTVLHPNEVIGIIK